VAVRGWLRRRLHRERPLSERALLIFLLAEAAVFLAPAVGALGLLSFLAATVIGLLFVLPALIALMALLLVALPSVASLATLALAPRAGRVVTLAAQLLLLGSMAAWDGPPRQRVVAATTTEAFFPLVALALLAWVLADDARRLWGRRAAAAGQAR